MNQRVRHVGVLAVISLLAGCADESQDAIDGSGDRAGPVADTFVRDAPDGVDAAPKDDVIADVPYDAAADRRAENTNACTTRVQAKAYAFAEKITACTSGDRCEFITWDELLGRRGCAPAFASYALFPAGSDRANLAASGRELAAEYEACGACGVAGYAAVDAATCDVDAGRCVVVR